MLEVPVNVTVAFELIAFEEAVNVTCCAVPGVRVMLRGETVTPGGTPVICTLICEEKLPVAVADRLATACEPAFTDCIVGLTDKLKSGFEGGVNDPPPPPLPPQEVSIKTSANVESCQPSCSRGDAGRRNVIMMFTVE